VSEKLIRIRPFVIHAMGCAQLLTRSRGATPSV